MKIDSKKLPYWKHIWLVCSGVQQISARDAVVKELKEYEEHFLVGLHQFQSGKLEQNQKMKKSPDINERLWEFVKRLSAFLDISTDLALAIVTQYLLCEFNGTPTKLQNLTTTNTASSKLIRDIWYFYTAERMFYLKTLKLMLEYHTSKTHPYHQEFANFINNHGIDVLRETLISQFKLLMSQNINASEDMTAEMQTLWVRRNIQEQIEIVQCLILTQDVSNITPKECNTLLELFSCHRFGTQPIYLNDVRIVIPKNLQSRLTLCQIALLISILDTTIIFKNFNEWDSTKVRQDMDTWMNRLVSEFTKETTTVVLAWILIRCDLKYQPNVQMVQDSIRSLNIIVSNTLFQDKSKTSYIVRKSIFNMLNLLNKREWNLFAEDDYFQCLSQVLKDSETALTYYNEQEENSEIPREQWLFPYKVNYYCLIANGLANADPQSFNKVLEESFQLPVVCLPFSDDLARYVKIEDGVFHLKINYYLLGNTCIPAGTFCTIDSIENPKTIHCQHKINFWEILSSLIEMFINDIRNSLQSLPFNEIQAAFQFWLTVLINLKPKSKYLQQIVAPVDLVFEMISEMLLKRLTNTDIYAVSLDVLTAVYKLTKNSYIATRLQQIGLFPILIDSYLPIEQIIKPHNFIQGRIFELILDFDLIHSRYNLLKAYLNFLRVRFELKVTDYNIFEIPGMIFMLQDILPKFSEWKTDIGSPEQDVLYDCIFLLFNILREPLETNPNHNLFQVLQKICIFDLLHITNGKVILNIVAGGNRYLEMLMQSETNWISGPCIQYLHIVQMSLTTLMLLFQKKPLIADRNSDMPLEVLMFTQPKEEDTLQIIQNITSYMDHIFNKHLPVLACRILRKFALKLQISLRGCFDMDSDQIRHVFIHRLRNKDESDEMKIAILDFVIACVQRQPGLTQTFFSKSTPSDLGASLDEDDSLLSLMEEFLVLISSAAGVLYNPIFGSMMTLFYELWNNQKQVVVSVVRNNETFWQKICSPLKFEKIMPTLIKSYSQILNIISLEIYSTTSSINRQLKEIIESLLNPEKDYFNRWIQYIFNENKIGDKIDEHDSENNMPNWLSLLVSWKNFLTVLINRHPSLIDTKARSMLGHICLSALVRELSDIDDPRVVVTLAQIYVLMLSNWQDEIFDKRSETIDLLSKIIVLIHNSHFEWSHSIRVAILSTTVYCIRYLKDEIRCDPVTAMKMFNFACKLACEELNMLETQQHFKNDNSVNKRLAKAQEIILKINLLNEILIVCNDMPNMHRCCVHMKLCLRLVQCLCVIVHQKMDRPITLAVLDCIIHLLQTEYGNEFLSCDFSLKLWVKFLPPKELLKKDRNPFDEELWNKEEWQPLYQRILLIVGLLLRKFHSRFLEDALAFIVIHDTYLIECISAIRFSIDINTLKMVESAVTFIYEIIKYQKQWKPYHLESYLQILKSIQTTLYCAVAFLLRPNSVKYEIDKTKTNERIKPDFEESFLSTEVIEVINKLIDIVTRTSQVLLKQAPSLLSLLCNDYTLMEPCTLILDVQFNTPKLVSDGDLELSYGTVLSAISLFSRSLQYIQSSDKKSTRKSVDGRVHLSPRKRLGASVSITENIPSKLNTSLPSDFIELFPASPSINITNNSWLRYLDKDKSIRALEVLLTLLSTQTLIYLKYMQEPKKNRQIICREINSELVVFYEYVKKLSRTWMSRTFEDHLGIPRNNLSSTPIICKAYNNLEPRDLSKSYVTEDVDPYTMHPIPKHLKLLREKIANIHFKYNDGVAETRSDGDPIPILSKVKFDFPDNFVFLSNLFTSICKQEDV